MSKNATLRGVIFALTAGVCWGLSGTLGQYLFTYKAMDPAWLTVWRMVISGVILLAIAGAQKPASLTLVWRDRRNALRLVLFGICGLMAVQYCYMQAIRYSNAGTATAVQYLGEALLLLYACLSARRWPRWLEVGALLLAMVGIFLLSTHGDAGRMVLSRQGLFWGLASAVALALYTLLPSRLIARYGSTSVTGYGLLIGGVVLAALTQPWKAAVALDGQTLLAMAGIILVGTVLSFTLYLRSVVDLGGVKAGLLAAVETVSAPFFAAVWLHTPFETADYLGFACIVLMVVVLAVPALRQSRAAAG